MRSISRANLPLSAALGDCVDRVLPSALLIGPLSATDGYEKPSVEDHGTLVQPDDHVPAEKHSTEFR